MNKEKMMKNLMMILGLMLLAMASGCGGLYGRGRMGAYGGVGYGSGPYGSAGGGVGGPMASGPMVGVPGSTAGALPVGARGRISPYGGSAYYGTGYTNPELTMMAASRRAEWMAASAAVPSVPMTSSPCADGSCPLPEAEVTSDPELEARIEAVEDQLLADHAPR